MKPTRTGTEVSLNRDLVSLIHRVCDRYEFHIETVRDRDSYDIP